MLYLPASAPSAPPTPKAHIWESDWLNPEKTCKTCGATWWKKAAGGTAHGKFRYTDVEGNSIRCEIELPCPIYRGQEAVLQREAVQELEKEKQVLDARVLVMEARMGQLEEQNYLLREAIALGPKIDMQELAQAMLDLLEKKRLLGEPLALPEVIQALPEAKTGVDPT